MVRTPARPPALRLARFSAAAPDSWLYLGAFARSLAFQTLHGLSGAGAIHSHAATPSEPLLLSLLASLQRAGLATRDAAGWHLAAESGLPAPGDILQTFAAEHPAASAEIVLAARAMAALPRALSAGEDVPLRPGTLEHFESSALLLGPVLDEFRGHVALRSGGHYDSRYVSIFTFDGAGKIKNVREYFNPMILTKAFSVSTAKLQGFSANEQDS